MERTGVLEIIGDHITLIINGVMVSLFVHSKFDSQGLPKDGKVLKIATPSLAMLPDNILLYSTEKIREDLILLPVKEHTATAYIHPNKKNE